MYYKIYLIYTMLTMLSVVVLSTVLLNTYCETIKYQHIAFINTYAKGDNYSYNETVCNYKQPRHRFVYWAVYWAVAF